MAIEQRFATEYRENAIDDPGLVLSDDGKVYVVKADRSRVQVTGGGGSAPVMLSWFCSTSDAPTSPSGNLVLGGSGDVHMNGFATSFPFFVDTGGQIAGLFVVTAPTLPAGVLTVDTIEMGVSDMFASEQLVATNGSALPHIAPGTNFLNDFSSIYGRRGTDLAVTGSGTNEVQVKTTGGGVFVVQAFIGLTWTPA